MIHTSTYPDVSIPESQLTPFVLQHAERLADQSALIDGPSGRTLTYGELSHAVKALAGGLQAKGFQKGDVLGILLPNIPEYALAFHGAAWAGGAVTTINPTYGPDEVRHQLNDSGAKFLVTVSPLVELALAGAEGTSVEKTVTVDPSDLDSLSDLFGEPLTEPVETSVDDVVCLPYSSGTTGLSKGVMLTHKNLVANLIQSAAIIPIEESEHTIAFLPFFHIYGMQVLMNAALFNGGVVVTMPRFDLEEFLELLQTHKVERAFVVPPIVLAMAKHPLVDKYDLSSLKSLFSGAAPLGSELAEEAGNRLGCEVAQGLWHDRTLAGFTRHARRTVQTWHYRDLAAFHRMPHCRPRYR